MLLTRLGGLRSGRWAAVLCASAVGSVAGAGDDRRVEASAASDGSVVLDVAALREAAAAPGAFRIGGLPVAGRGTLDLRVERFTITGPRTRFVAGRRGGAADAELRFDPSQVVLLRGAVEGDEGSHVFLAVSPWGGVGRIEPAGSAAPLAVRFAGSAAAPRAGAHPPGVPLCGLETGGRVALSGGPVPPPPAVGQIELAVDTDYELYSLFGDLDAAAAYVVSLYGAVSDIYLRDVNARVHLTFVRLWDTPQDLFNEPDPLGEFVDHWNQNMGSVVRDAAQLLSGRRDLPYGGVAYLSALCGDFAYSVVGYALGFFEDPVLPGPYQYDIHVTAHELGHNCGALHTHSYGLDDCDDLVGAARRGTIMSYCSQTRSGGNSNTDLRFHSLVQQEMRNHIYTSKCIAADCNGNGVADGDDIALGSSPDANGDGVPDECEDCNGNVTLDATDIVLGLSEDDNSNGIPDECEPDCDGNGVPDDLDIAGGADDLYGNNVPDSCEADCDGNGVSDYTQIMSDMSLDVDRDTVLDSCQDCDGDGETDLEALQGARGTWVASLSDGGLYEFHAVSGARVRTTGAGIASSAWDVLITPGGRILVSSSGNDRVVEVSRDGTVVGNFVAPGSGGLDEPTGMTLRPGGNLLVASRGTNAVLEYDGDTGAFVGAFVASGAGGLVQPAGITYGPSGDLYVATGNDRVLKYDGATGAPLGAFVTQAGNGGLDDPRGIVFKPDGNLLVSSFLTDQILEYDGDTGAFIGQFNHNGTETALTLDGPWGLRIGPDGYVYVVRHDVTPPGGGGGGLHDHHDGHLHINASRIYAFDAGSGNFVRSYVTGHDTELYLPTGFDFMPDPGVDCNANQLPDSCDIASGSSADRNGNGVPDECDLPGDVDGDGSVGITDLLALLSAWGPCPGDPAPCPADIDGDGSVGITDLLALLANWTG